MFLFRNPAGCVVPVQIGQLEKEKLLKVHGSFQLHPKLATQEHLIVRGLEDFWEVEIDW